MDSRGQDSPVQVAPSRFRALLGQPLLSRQASPYLRARRGRFTPGGLSAASLWLGLLESKGLSSTPFLGETVIRPTVTGFL